MSHPPTWKEYQKWVRGDSPDERELKEQLQACVERRRTAAEFLPILQEYLSFLRWKETHAIMKNPAKHTELTFTDALNRLETDMDQLQKGRLSNA